MLGVRASHYIMILSDERHHENIRFRDVRCTHIVHLPDTLRLASKLSAFGRCGLRSAHLASALRMLGVRASHYIAIFYRNCLQASLTQFGKNGYALLIANAHYTTIFIAYGTELWIFTWHWRDSWLYLLKLTK
jgi:hypothetical protein